MVFDAACHAKNCLLGRVPGGRKCSMCNGRGSIPTRLGAHMFAHIIDLLFVQCDCTIPMQGKHTTTDYDNPLSLFPPADPKCQKCRGRKVTLSPIGELLCSFVRQQIHAPKSTLDHAPVVSKSPAETKAEKVDTISHTKAGQGTATLPGAPTHVSARAPEVRTVPTPVNGSSPYQRTGTPSKRHDNMDVRLP